MNAQNEKLNQSGDVESTGRKLSEQELSSAHNLQPKIKVEELKTKKPKSAKKNTDVPSAYFAKGEDSSVDIKAKKVKIKLASPATSVAKEKKSAKKLSTGKALEKEENASKKSSIGKASTREEYAVRTGSTGKVVKKEKNAGKTAKTKSPGKKLPVAQNNASAQVEVKTTDVSTADLSAKGPGKLTFQLRYHTVPGEQIFVTGDHAILGSDDLEKALPLQYLNDDYWFGELELSETLLSEPIKYKYFVKGISGELKIELGTPKVFYPGEYAEVEVRLVDTWDFSGYYQNTFFTEPFQSVLLKNNLAEVPASAPETFTHIFRVKAPLLSKNQVIHLHGSAAEMGRWALAEPVALSRKAGEEYWTVKLDLSNASYPITYKYALFDTATQTHQQLETGSNRVVYDGSGPGKFTLVNDGFAVLPVNNFKGAGVAIPVFSLRSNNSFGVGEFSDIKLLVDWARHIGLKVVQILPVNDTTATHTWVDSYPYAAISAFALHPIFTHLPAVATPENQHVLNDYQALQQELNALEEVDYERVMSAKLEALKALYPLQKEATFSGEDFTGFYEENKHWLLPYAAFSYLRDEFGSPDFATWSTHSEYNEAEILQLGATPDVARDEIGIHYFTQYHLHLQLKAATAYAHQNGIIVKGDIPIGIYRNSADAWQEPELYNMDQQAGAPPDDFAVKGQNWGFPTYNWKKMQHDGFQWWKRRFKQMSYYFDAFRIDHILGFFRIWSIPLDAVEGIMGRFVPAVPVYRNELEQRGFYDGAIHRLTTPYINDGVLLEVFGELASIAKEQFLDHHGNGLYTMKHDFDTQRKVEYFFVGQLHNGENEKLQNGLYTLISNVILFEEVGGEGQRFHFRISMDNTSSFRYLDGDAQHKMRELYVNYFFRRQDHYWAHEAMQKLPELKRSTNMLICGEDLGMVPDCVPGVMNTLGILSLEIQRMPKDPKKEFFHPNDAPYLSVVTPSTHDMSTIRGWWEEDTGKTQRFYNHHLGKWGKAPFFCEPEINTAIIIQHLYSPAMWSIFQLQDLLGMDGILRRNKPAAERINVPANPKHYWRYRMHFSLEELLQKEDFNTKLFTALVNSGRA
jgi:4-alpha-glucanotransferase